MWIHRWNELYTTFRQNRISFLKMIISKCKISYDLVARSAKIFCIKRCIFETAHVLHFIDLESSFLLIIFIFSIFLIDESFRVDNDRVLNVKSWRRFCHSRFSRLNRICMLIQVFLTDEIKFQQQHVALHAYFAYFCIRLHINEMLIWESRSYSSLINLVNEIRITSIDEIQVVFANFNLTIYCSACHWRSSFHSQQHSSIH
jgi:hypothetical protein